MNKELLLKVKAAILEHPEQLDMRNWHNRCGTTHCIAGWAQLIQRGRADAVWCLVEAITDLDIDGKEVDRLFWVSDWPEDLRSAYKAANRCGDFKQAALVAADRIDHFIATEGAE